MTEADPLERRCIQCRAPLSFPSQPGEASCPACGIRQYLTGPTDSWPDGAIGAYPSGKRTAFSGP